MDWKKCFLCQLDNGVPTVDPQRRLGNGDNGDAYATIAEYVTGFHVLGLLPFDLDIDGITVGSDLSSTLQANHAVWHKTCKNKIDKQKLERARKHKASGSLDRASKTNIGTRRRSGSVGRDEQREVPLCIFCDRPHDSKSPLHAAATFGIDFKVRNAARELNDTKLLAKLAGGDMIAIEAKYHTACLAKYYRRAGQMKSDTDQDEDKPLCGIAFADLVAYIESCRGSNSVFYLSKLCKMYSNILCELGVDAGRTHGTRLKAKLLDAIPDLKETTKDKLVLLAFDHAISEALSKTCTPDFDYEGLILSRAASIIRRDTLAKQNTFSGTFAPDSQKNSVPASLAAFISMLLDGPCFQEHVADGDEGHSSLGIAQLIAFNTHGWPSTQPGSLHTAVQRKYTQPCSLFSRGTAVWTMGARLCEQWGTAVCKCPAV